MNDYALPPTGVDHEIAGRRLLILGGGLWQLPYVERARELGVETWVTDWSADAPARDRADHFVPIDLKDRATTLALASEARIDAVLTAADVGVPTAAYVADALGLPGHTPAIAEYATNKFKMRERARALGIPCPWYRRVRSPREATAAAAGHDFPVIVKPVDNCSSRGVQWVAHPADLESAAAAALAASPLGEALVEQFLVGTEGSIEALVQDGRVVVLGFCDKTKSPLPDRFDLELRYPGAFPANAAAAIRRLADQIAAGFEVVNGILHIEFLAAGAGDAIYLIEFAIRGCGSKVATDLMPALTGVDVVRVLVRQAFGLRTPIAPAASLHGALQFLMFPRGRVAAVHGVEAARSLPSVVDVRVERSPGEWIGEVHDGRSRPGYVLAAGRDRDDVQRTLRQVRGLVRLDYEDARGVAPIEITQPQVA